MIGSSPRAEYETMPDVRVDIPDRLDLACIRLPVVSDVRGTDG